LCFLGILQQDELTFSRQFSQFETEPSARIRTQQNIRSHVKTQHLQAWWSRVKNNVAMTNTYFLRNVYKTNHSKFIQQKSFKKKYKFSFATGNWMTATLNETNLEEEISANENSCQRCSSQINLLLNKKDSKFICEEASLTYNQICELCASNLKKTLNLKECITCNSKINLLVNDQLSKSVCHKSAINMIGQMCEICFDSISKKKTKKKQIKKTNKQK
jgi:hypothetical protein